MKDISPVPARTDIIVRNLSCLGRQERFLVGTGVHNGFDINIEIPA